MTPRSLLIIFARTPELGRVKTRLARTVGDLEALRIYRELGARVVDAVTPDGTATARYDVRVAVTPDHGEHAIHDWLGADIAVVPQGDGDLGHRMAAAIGAAFDDGADRAVVIGTDCPAIDRSVALTAFEALDSHDAVFGPAADGGYYLVGVRRAARARALPALFDGIPWSSDTTLASSLAAAARHGLGVALLPLQHDIDTEADWRAYLERS